MTDQARGEVNRYARLGPIARALVDDYDEIALAELLVKADDDLERARQELQQHAEAESADAAAGSYAGRAERAEAQLTAVAGLIADHEGDEWAAHPATTALRGILDEDVYAIAQPAPNNPAATEATDIETTARVFAALHRSAEETVTRVIDLYEQWVKAGPPPLGVSMSRRWDRRLVELRGAIRPDGDNPTGEQP